MTERKFTDEEVIRALELCYAQKGTSHTCAKCPYHKFGTLCKIERDRDALDLINRQRAEIEERNNIIGKIRKAMYHILLVEYDGQPIPRKNTSRHDVYRACYQIQEILWQIRSQEIALWYAQHEKQNAAETDTNVGNKYFTAEQVRKMTREEVRKNYSAIMKSMEKWGEQK